MKAPNNLQQSASSHYGSYSGGGSSSCFKLDICPDLLLAGLVAAFAAIFYLLHTAITMKGRKKRRSLSFNDRNFFKVKYLWDVVNYGTVVSSFCTFQVARSGRLLFCSKKLASVCEKLFAKFRRLNDGRMRSLSRYLEWRLDMSQICSFFSLSSAVTV